MKEYVSINKDEFENKFKKGYGASYPESSVIRLYELFYRQSMGKEANGKKLLDFGCARGIHSQYFIDKGFDVYGIDISEEAIKYCKENIDEDRFKSIDIVDENIDLYEVFGCKFDVIFANHVLYYFNDDDLEKVLNKFNNILSEDGIVIFTMMSTNCYFYNFVDFENSKSDIKRVLLRGRVNDETFINFISNETELKGKFRMFDRLYTGKYDFYAPEGSTEHLYYIGRKKK